MHTASGRKVARFTEHSSFLHSHNRALLLQSRTRGIWPLVYLVIYFLLFDCEVDEWSVLAIMWE